MTIQFCEVTGHNLIIIPCCWAFRSFPVLLWQETQDDRLLIQQVFIWQPWTAIFLCTKVSSPGADSQAGGADMEINKSTEVFPFPQGNSEYSLGSHLGRREKREEKVLMDLPTCTGQCIWMSWATAYSLGLRTWLMCISLRHKSNLHMLTVSLPCPPAAVNLQKW